MVDGTLAETGLLTTTGEDLFPIIFRLTNYDDIDFCVANMRIKEDQQMPVSLYPTDIL